MIYDDFREPGVGHCDSPLVRVARLPQDRRAGEALPRAGQGQVERRRQGGRRRTRPEAGVQEGAPELEAGRGRGRGQSHAGTSDELQVLHRLQPTAIQPIFYSVFHPVIR